MCSSIAKCILMLINSIFMLVAVALIVVGVIIAFVPSVVLEPAYKEAKAAAAKDGYSIPDSAEEMKSIPLVYDIGLALFIFGICLFVLSALAWCGACCTSCCRCLLIVFAIIMILLMIAEIIVGTLFYVTDSPMHKTIKDELKKKIKNEYNDTGKDAFSTALNLVHKYFKCCGIDSEADFGGKSHKSCEKENLKTGCYKKLTNLIDDNIIWAGLVLAGILALQLLEVILAIIIYRDNKIGII